MIKLAAAIAASAVQEALNELGLVKKADIGVYLRYDEDRDVDEVEGYPWRPEIGLST